MACHFRRDWARNGQLAKRSGWNKEVRTVVGALVPGRVGIVSCCVMFIKSRRRLWDGACGKYAMCTSDVGHHLPPALEWLPSMQQLTATVRRCSLSVTACCVSVQRGLPSLYSALWCLRANNSAHERGCQTTNWNSSSSQTLAPSQKLTLHQCLLPARLNVLWLLAMLTQDACLCALANVSATSDCRLLVLGKLIV